MIHKISFGSKWQRLITFSVLYISEGIPIGFSNIAVVAYLRMNGISTTELGVFLSALIVPWTFKWAWAPLVDLIHFKRFGSKRVWIFIAQSSMIMTLGAIVFFDVAKNLNLLTAIMVFHNIFAATQDIAIDALAITVLPENERGIANGFMFGGRSLGLTVGGSAAIYIVGAFSFNAALLYILIILTAIVLMVTLQIHEPEAPGHAYVIGTSPLRQATERLRGFASELYKGFFKSGIGPKIGIIFSLLPSGALALMLVLIGTIQVDLGMNESQIAKMTALSNILGALGCVIGGWISDKIGHRKALAVWYVLTMVPTFYLASQFIGVSGMQGVTLMELYISLLSYNFSAGLVLGTSTALFMDLTNPLVAGTQFTGYMALCNIVYSYTNLWQGKFADVYGYAKTLNLDGILVLIPLILIPFLKPSIRARNQICQHLHFSADLKNT